jgi:hypothetical protein
MRRDDTGFVDAVTGEGKKVRRKTPVSESSSARKKSSMEKEIVVKSEEDDNTGASKWMDLPSLKSTEEPESVMKPHITLGDEESEEERETQRRESVYEDQTILPLSVITSRKRRTSSLVTSLSGMNDPEQPDLKRKIDDDEETRGRKNTLIARVKTLNPYDAEDRGGDWEKGRDRAVGTSTRRRSMMV